jgi:hypothetical protein
MAKKIHRLLKELEATGRLPSVIGYHRVDGPGSSLSLPLFQRALYAGSSLVLVERFAQNYWMDYYYGH